MKITELKTFIVGNPPPYHGGRYFIFVKLTTNTGITGIGEVYTASFGPNALKAMIEDVFEHHVLGADPFQIETLWRNVYGRGYSQRPDISLMGVLSGLECALWDIVGKAVEKPIYALLGGKVHERLRSYTYIYPKISEGHAYSDSPVYRDPDAAAERAIDYMKQGFTAVKFDPAGAYSTFDPRQPSLEYLSELAESARRTAKSLEGGHWPTSSVFASLMQDYPNGPIAESVTQKTFGINLNFPLFAGGETLYAVRSQKRQAEATEETRAQSARDLLDSWLKARDQTASLRLQQVLTRRAAERAEEVARLRYEAYKLGQLRYLDVEDANLKEVQAKVEAATTNVSLLIQLANLESLSE